MLRTPSLRARAACFYYAVAVGRKPGVYTSWAECEQQVKGFKDPVFKALDSQREARKFVSKNAGKRPQDCYIQDKDVRGKFYAVARGQAPGIYHDWATCKAQVSGYPDARFKGFGTYTEAIAFIKENGNYFAMVPGFRPDDSAPFDDEFDRFATSQRIEPDSKEYRIQRTVAIKRELDVLYLSQPTTGEEGEENNDDGKSPGIKEHGTERIPQEELLLRALRELCLQVGLEPCATAPECELAIKKVGLINIIDFLDAKRYGKPVEIWPWARFAEFVRYTLGDKKKCMVLGIAKDHPLLRALLQDLSSKGGADSARAMAAKQDYDPVTRRIEMRTGLRNSHVLLEEAETQASPTTSPPTT